MPVIKSQTKRIHKASGIVDNISIEIDIPTPELNRVFRDKPL